MKTEQAVGALAALAQDSRLELFRMLVARGPEGHTVGEIASRLRIPGPTLSFHLRTLSQAGLVGARREGRFLRYAANFERMNALVGYLTEHCCSRGAACDPSCAPAPATLEPVPGLSRLVGERRKARR